MKPDKALELEVDKLRCLFNYDPSTGLLTWRNTRPGPKRPSKEAGTLDGKGYRQVCINGRLVRGHRICFAIHYGSWPRDYLDHVNGIKTDNRIGNLREATKAQNNENSRLRSHNTSGVKGVYWHKTGKKWAAQITHGGKKLHLGFFDDLSAAADAVRAARLELHGEFAHHG